MSSWILNAAATESGLETWYKERMLEKWSNGIRLDVMLGAGNK